MNFKPLVCAVLLLLGACASGGRKADSTDGLSLNAAEGSPRLCKPLLPGPDWEERPPHACSNRVWEVPAAIVVYPLLIGVGLAIVGAPIWVPLLLL